MIEKKTPPSTPSDETMPDRRSYLQKEDEEIDLAALWETLRNGWRLVGATVLTCTLLAVTAAFYMTPYYRSEVLLAPADDEGVKNGLAGLAGQFGGLADLAGIGISSGDKEEAIALLKSRTLIQQFIADKQLLPVIFYKEWDAEKKNWKSDDTDDIPTLNEAYEVFDDRIRDVKVDKKTGLVTFSITWRDREQAAEWAEELVRRANLKMREMAKEEANRSLQYLNLELRKAAALEVQQSIFKMMEAQIKTIMVANTREQFAFKIIDAPVVADKDEYVHPKRLLVILFGFASGVFAGVVWVVLRGGKRRQT